MSQVFESIHASFEKLPLSLFRVCELTFKGDLNPLGSEHAGQIEIIINVERMNLL